MNTVSTKTNAAAIPTGLSHRRPSCGRTSGLFDIFGGFKRVKSSKLKVQSSRELPSSELQGSKAPVFLRCFDPGGLRFGARFELCSLTLELRRAHPVRRAPAFRSAPSLYQLPHGRGERPDGVN